MWSLWREIKGNKSVAAGMLKVRIGVDYSVYNNVLDQKPKSFELPFQISSLGMLFISDPYPDIAIFISCYLFACFVLI